MTDTDPTGAWYFTIVGLCWFSAGLQQDGPMGLIALLFVPFFVGVARQDRRTTNGNAFLRIS